MYDIWNKNLGLPAQAFIALRKANLFAVFYFILSHLQNFYFRFVNVLSAFE